MARPIVTILAKLRNTFGKQFFVNAAMNLMTSQTVLLNGRMFPYRRSPFISMALEAELSTIISLHHASAEGAMRQMAGGAFDLPFDDWMM